jgi:hypothetical protein
MTQKQIIDLPIGAGVYTEQTERGAVGRWKIADKVRFRKGLAEKIGGWVQLQPRFLGTARRLKDWTSLDARQWTAIGTESKLYLWQGEILYDITPLRDSGTLTAPFDTTLGSSIVNVEHANHGVQVGDFVRFSGAIAGGGITVDGEYVVTSIVDQDNYTIVDDETATSTATNTGGTPSYEYDISVGVASVVSATGWNAGSYGTDRTGYNTPLVGSGNALLIPIRTWTLDNWGEDLLACPRGGAIYWWDKTLGPTTRAVALGGDAPPVNEGVIISQRDRHVIALGAYDYFNSRIDPLLIRWSSTEDLNDWVPTSTNTSGDLRLYSGSKIVTAVRSRLELVVFTDVSVHTLPFVGGFDVFGLNIVGENVSILGPNCAVPVDSRVFFMAEADFYMYDGIVRTLPCDVRNYVYENLNVQQSDKIYGGLNREFNEVWWFYPSYDPNTWVQDTFELGLPPGYSLADSTTTVDNLFNDVLFQGDFEGTNGQTTYTEESSYAASATFFGATQISTTSPIFDTSSLDLGSAAASERVEFPIATLDVPDWDGTGRILTGEVTFRFDTLHTSGTKDIIIVGDSDFNIFRVGVNVSGGNVRLRAGFSTTGGLSPTVTLTQGTDYVVIVESDYTAGAGNGVERTWFGPKGGTISLLETKTSQTAKDPTSLLSELIKFGGASGLFGTDGVVDHTRITNSTVGRYGTASTVTIDDPYPTVHVPGGPADIGYVYNFNASGFTEVAATADNNYEHDYFLTNADPILTPTLSEYAVELDVNPDIGVGSGRAGLCFLRTNLIGTPETDGDDAQQLMAEIDYTNNQISVWKKTASGVAAPANQAVNTISFTTVTGSAITTGQKYIIKAQFNTPQVTIWVDDNQAFQFDLDATELTQFASGTAGLHQTPGSEDDMYRFYNFATGPLGTITASDFDISPIEVNSYVAFNYEENTWTIGKLARSAWADRSPVLEKAYAAGLDGYLYQHETGTDDNGAAMTAFIESFDFEIPNAGEFLMHVDQLIPDFLELEGTVDLYLSGRKYPQDPNRITKGPYTVQTGVRKLSTRIRARQVALRVESTTTGDKWRMGTIRGRAGPHGRRG